MLASDGLLIVCVGLRWTAVTFPMLVLRVMPTCGESWPSAHAAERRGRGRRARRSSAHPPERIAESLLHRVRERQRARRDDAPPAHTIARGVARGRRLDARAEIAR